MNLALKVSKVNLKEQKSDALYWQSQSHATRFAALEQIRREYHAWKYQKMFNPDFQDFIQCLNQNAVRYLVVGGYAVAIHGHPRYTKDMDIWLEISPDNAQRLLQALDQFGFGQLGLTAEDFLNPDQVIQLGYPPNRIDLLTTIDGVNFEDCYPSRLEITVDNLTVYFIDLESLKKNKKASGSLQDLADIENLT